MIDLKNKAKRILKTLAGATMTLAVPLVAWAQNPALENLKGAGGGGGFNTAQTDPTLIVGDIIGYALGLLGVVFLILIIYAGFLWMTASGNEEQIGKAKKMLTNAVIGIAIVSLAYVITAWVVDYIAAQGVADTNKL